MTVLATVLQHWVEYLVEAVLLGLFVMAASALGTLPEYPNSPAHGLIPNPWLRRALMALGVGAAVLTIIYSPLGARSGAHLNPALTLTYLRLGKVQPSDALFYVLAQFVGAALVVALMARWLGAAFTDPPVCAIATLPGTRGPVVAFLVELAMSFTLMTVVLMSTNSERLARRTGIFVAALMASFIFVATPLSGMSMNPARSFASALGSSQFQFLWIYFTAPVAGMLLAGELFRRRRPVICAKLNHTGKAPCIFDCGYRSK